MPRNNYCAFFFFGAGIPLPNSDVCRLIDFLMNLLKFKLPPCGRFSASRLAFSSGRLRCSVRSEYVRRLVLGAALGAL